MRVLITDGNERVALAVARSLVRAGHAVWVAAPTRVSLAGVSRAVRPCLLATDPLTDPARYATEVARIASEQGAQILLPLTDASVEIDHDARRCLAVHKKDGLDVGPSTQCSVKVFW